MNITQKLHDTLTELSEVFIKNGKLADSDEKISAENYALLKEMKFFSSLVPAQFGGGNVDYAQMSNILKQLAHYHPSTALSASMHQHIVSANRFNHAHGKSGQAVLEKVAANEWVLVSTGAGDWLSSNGVLTKTEGGYSLTATKHFASGSTQGNLLVTSAPYEDPELGWQVLHFPVAIKSEGVTILDNWQPMGMSGTGSNSVQLDNVFVPEASVALKRPQGDFHAIWCVVLPVALPLIMSVYVGIAEKAAEKARDFCKTGSDTSAPYTLGEMENSLTTAQIVLNDMIRTVDEFNFTPSTDTVNEMVKRKTIVATQCTQVVHKAIDACGGVGYMKSLGLECLLRDVMASHFHPMTEKKQFLFTGSLALGKEIPSASL